MTITLFHGTLGFLAAALLATGAVTVLIGIENWLRDRLTLDLRPLWHVIPRRFKVHLRWDRPGAYVTFGNGRQGFIVNVFEADNVDQILLIQPCTADDDAYEGDPEWVLCSDIGPDIHPRRSFRETWRELCHPESGDA